MQNLVDGQAVRGLAVLVRERRKYLLVEAGLFGGDDEAAQDGRHTGFIGVWHAFKVCLFSSSRT